MAGTAGGTPRGHRAGRAWAAFGGAAVVLLVVLVVLGTVLPERVPMHFGASREADEFGDRATFLALAAGAGALLAALFGGAAALVERVPLTVVTVPHPDYWKAPERAPELRRRLRTDLLVIGALTLLLLAVVFAFSGEAAVRGGPLSAWVPVVLGGYVAVVLAYCVHLATRRYRPPSGR
ncbi:DUF1648 domain-containing protein [Geodermatophilus sp. YIM 151500]|uniref:DUF1648 domain-containing protein n=1 Tax=Geodermatophilus sp. YIM 151500 TaxID=2984531 RepID=UPI0021E40FDF|nr:DUF1648 domain-containing protein [Geodermatophilus sp. YIM 151500]MCV2489616.1 DUF1648 domain-containing protein [Geodermatophilus sp. YIM 151500]